MKAVLYLSRATQTFEKDQLQEIEAKSAANNAKLGLSGYLYFDGVHFLQYLEGEEKLVDPLLEIIRDDPRHAFLCETEEQIEEKRFPEWSMKNIQSILLEMNLVEKTIIQTLSLFGDKGYRINQGMSKDLFKLMDHLKAVVY